MARNTSYHGWSVPETGDTDYEDTFDTWFDDVDVEIIEKDTIANQPAAGTVDRWFLAHDEPSLYYDDGTSWNKVAGSDLTGETQKAANFEAAQGTGTPYAYHFESDTDTGLYRTGSDALALATGGVSGLQVNSTQDVVIPNGDLTDGTNTIFDATNAWVPISILEANSVTVAGNAVTLGGSTTVSYVDLNDTGSSFPIPNSDLANSSVTVAGNSVSLGGSTSVSARDLSDSGSIAFRGDNENIAGNWTFIADTRVDDTYNVIFGTDDDFGWWFDGSGTSPANELVLTYDPTGTSPADVLRVRTDGTFDFGASTASPTIVGVDDIRARSGTNLYIQTAGGGSDQVGFYDTANDAALLSATENRQINHHVVTRFQQYGRFDDDITSRWGTSSNFGMEYDSTNARLRLIDDPTSTSPVDVLRIPFDQTGNIDVPSGQLRIFTDNYLRVGSSGTNDHAFRYNSGNSDFELIADPDGTSPSVVFRHQVGGPLFVEDTQFTIRSGMTCPTTIRMNDGVTFNWGTNNDFESWYNSGSDRLELQHNGASTTEIVHFFPSGNAQFFGDIQDGGGTNTIWDSANTHVPADAQEGGESVVASGTVTLSSGSATISTGVTTSATNIDVRLDPSGNGDGSGANTASVAVAARVYWRGDLSTPEYEVEILEDGTSVGNPDVSYKVVAS